MMCTAMMSASDDVGDDVHGDDVGVLVFPRHWHPTAMPHALRRATQVPRPRSARAPLDLGQVGGWLPPPYKNLHVPPARDAQAEPPRRVWVGRLRGWGISNLYQSLGKPILSF